MAKPIVVPSWATNANYSAGVDSWSATPNKTAPAGGNIAEGYQPTEKPAAQYLNYLLHWLGQWAAYLNSGALDGPITITGNLTVTGATDIGTDLLVGGDVTVSGGIGVTDGVFASGFSTDFSGNLQVVGILGHGEDSVTDIVARAAVPSGLTVGWGVSPYNEAPQVTVPSGSFCSMHSPPLGTGSRITKFRLSGTGSVGSTAPTFHLKQLFSNGTLGAAIPFTTVLVGAVTSDFEYSVTITTPTPLADGALYVLTYIAAGGVSSVLRNITTFFARTV